MNFNQMNKQFTSNKDPSYSFVDNYPNKIFFAMKNYSSSLFGWFLSFTKNAAPKFPLPIHLISSNSSSYDI